MRRAADDHHLKLSERTRGIVGAGEIGRIKQGAILINTSRGPLIEEQALFDALNDRRIFAALDVYDTEPLPEGHPLLSAPNTILTSHLGYVCTDSMAGRCTAMCRAHHGLAER
jgi:phosphoglycerate dehydrogenase-like enzyme